MPNPFAVAGTNYKWLPGHYVLLFGMGKLADGGLAAHLAQIAGAAGTANNIPNLVGIQKRYFWKDLEPTKDNYKFDLIIEDLKTCKAAGKFLRPLITFKGFSGGKGAPLYLRPGQPGYEDAFGSGVYTWPPGSTTNEHPALYIPAVATRFKKFFQMMGQALDGGLSMAATDERWWLSHIDLNETSWGTVPALGTSTSIQNQEKMLQCFIDTYSIWKTAAPTTLLCHFLNFPNNSSFSVLNHPTLGLPKALKNLGFMLGSPDNWLDSPDLVGYPDRPGILVHYDNVRGLVGLCPSNQDANFSHKDHEGQREKIVSYDLTVNGTTVDLLFKRITTEGCTYKGVFRQPSHGQFIAWSARTSNLADDADVTTPPGSVKAWDLLRVYMRNLWNNDGPWKNSKTPYINTAVPELIKSSPTPLPGVLTVSLASDTGPLNNDKVTNNPALTVSGAVAGATLQYAVEEAGPWSTTPPVWIQGGNKVYVRQLVGSVPSDPSAPLEFKYDNVKPEFVRATVNEGLVRITWKDTVLLADEDPFRADKANFAVTINGTAANVFGRFVSPGIKFYRLEINPAAKVGDVVRVSYTQPTTGTARVQDIAGNYADNIVNVLCNNQTGVPPPTKTCVITELGGSPPGGYTREDQVIIKGTISAPLDAFEQVEIRKRNMVFPRTDPDTYYFVQLGDATVTGTTFQFQDLERGNKTFEYDARVRNGDLTGPPSALASVTVDDEPPAEPTVDTVTVRIGQPFVASGRYGGAVGDVVEVGVQGEPSKFTTANGLVVNPTARTWSITLAPKPRGRYAVTAKVTDPAGNFSENEAPGWVDVVGLPNINDLRLAFAKRLPPPPLPAPE